jgi:hypothetical protein
LPAVPSLLLILGSLLLVLWRAAGRRTGWAVEAVTAGLALAVGLLLGRSIPAQSSFDLWPSGVVSSGSIEFSLTPWSWAVLVCVLGFGLSRALTLAPVLPPQKSEAQPASLAFTGAIALASVAGNLLTLVLTWTFAIAVQAWLTGTGRSDETSGPAWRQVQGRDFATLLFLIAAFAFWGPTASGRLPAFVLLGLAAVLRIWSGVSPRVPGDGWAATVGFPTAASVLVALSWGWAEAIGETPALWLAVVGLVILLAGWLSGWLAEAIDLRARGWVVGVCGLALFATAAAPGQAEASLATAGVVIIVAGSLGIVLSPGKIGSRVGAAVAALTMVGIPGLVGAVFFGAFGPGEGDSLLPWLGVIGAGLMASAFSRDVLRPTTAPASPSGLPLALMAASVMVVLNVMLYLRLRQLVPAPSLAAAAVALLVAMAGAVLWDRIPEGRRRRIARAVRWPVAVRSPEGAAAGPVEEFLRGARDVLEGDASLLWALVVVVVGLLLLQGTT